MQLDLSDCLTKNSNTALGLKPSIKHSWKGTHVYVGLAWCFGEEVHLQFFGMCCSNIKKA